MVTVGSSRSQEVHWSLVWEVECLSYVKVDFREIMDLRHYVNYGFRISLGYPVLGPSQVCKPQPQSPKNKVPEDMDTLQSSHSVNAVFCRKRTRVIVLSCHPRVL
ncbi:hypothetical protein WG66_000401 [Moniliophthora roreri]|nr:hypothetical protein WG66_000401 [Moniliophthora roreri]